MTTATEARRKPRFPKKLRASWDKLLRLIPGYDPFDTARGGEWFHYQRAEEAIEFFQKGLTHVKGKLAGESFLLMDWQKAIIGNIFGWLREDWSRRYREAFIFVPRKNGKSLLAAGIGNFVLFCDPEPGAEIYCAAAERDQARLVFDVAKQQVLKNPELARNAGVYSRAITSGSCSFKPISADANTKHGFNSHAVIIDELHAQKDRELVDVLMTSTGAREQPIVVHITTSDFQRPGSICNEKHDYASHVRDGVIDDSSFLPVIYEATLEDDWTDPKVWAKANPCLGVSLSEEYLERECKRAQESVEYENTFKRLHLNIRTEQDVRFFAMARWDECGSEPDRSKRECFGGLDLAIKHDLAAFVLYFPDDHSVIPYFWCSEDRAREYARKSGIPMTTWASEGLVELTPGEVIDFSIIRRRVNEISGEFVIRDVGYDPYNAHQLCHQQLNVEDGIPCVEFRQGTISMNEPLKTLDKLINTVKIKHGGNKVLRWMASHMSVHQDHSGNIRPDRKKSTEKIDGVVALTMAIGRSLANENETSVYETEDFFI